LEIHPKRTSDKAGLPPGTTVYIGSRRDVKLVIKVLIYDKAGADSHVLKGVAELPDIIKLAKGRKMWIDLVGICHIEAVEKIGEIFAIHPLVLEDIANTEQRPKFEEFDDAFFITIKELNYHPVQRILDEKQISLMLGPDYVITFQEENSEIIEEIRKRLTAGVSRTRSRGVDFLAYRFIDSVVDRYFDVIEKIGDDIEGLEEKMIQDVSGKPMRSFQRMRRLLSVLVHAVFPLRESLSRIEKRDNMKTISKDTLPYFRDVYDHSVHIIESVENQRDILGGVIDVYLSYQNNRMNAVMKVLTIIATIFMPLSFFASVYGMNFKFFPELSWRYGYLFFWIFIVCVVLLMIYYFKKKKWLS